MCYISPTQRSSLSPQSHVNWHLKFAAGICLCSTFFSLFAGQRIIAVLVDIITFCKSRIIAAVVDIITFWAGIQGNLSWYSAWEEDSGGEIVRHNQDYLSVLFQLQLGPKNHDSGHSTPLR